MTLYNEEFYRKQSSESFNSAIEVFNIIKTLGLTIESAVDFGCGVGSWLSALKTSGVKKVVGVDGDYVPSEQLMISRDEFLPADLSQPANVSIEGEFDLAISLEVAEHLAAEVSDQFVELICNNADLVLFSAAIPYQGGHGHVNENWQSYWAEKFAKQGYYPLDIIRSSIWSNPKVKWWYKQNLVVYASESKCSELDQFHRQSEPYNLNIVHPEQYLTVAHRRSVGFGRNLNADFEYLSNLNIKKQKVEDNPRYGKEFSFVEPTETIKDIKTVATNDHYKENPVLKDAYSPVVFRPGYIQSLSSLNLNVNRPDFICIGAQKCGTTWLHRFLEKQNSIFVPPLKELNFFNSFVFDSHSAYSGTWRRDAGLERLRYALENNPSINENWLNYLFKFTKETVDSAWYESVFEMGEGKISGEITPEYAMLPTDAIEEVRRLLPDLKVLLLVRKPSSRAISHLNMINLNCEELSVSALKEFALSESVVQRSNYKEIYNRWSNVFGEESVHLDCLEAIADEPHAFLDRLATFFGCELDNRDFSAVKVHESVSSKKVEGLRPFVVKHYMSLENQFLESHPQFRKYW